jgi:creatinine amidohydrolase
MIDEQSVALARMTSPEAAEAITSAEVALIPVGATEQHGPNMTLETDTAVTYRLALHIAMALYPRAVVTPPIPYGVSCHHMQFPGTMTLSPETFQAVVLEVVDRLRQHGVERFFVVDGHAGNQGALDVLMTKLRFQMGIRAAYLFYFTLVDDIHPRRREDGALGTRVRGRDVDGVGVATGYSARRSVGDREVAIDLAAVQQHHEVTKSGRAALL